MMTLSDVFVAGGYANYPNIQTDFGERMQLKSEKKSWTGLDDVPARLLEKQLHV